MRRMSRTSAVAILPLLLLLGLAGCAKLPGPEPVTPTVELRIAAARYPLSPAALATINEAFTTKHPDVKIVMVDWNTAMDAYVKSMPTNWKTDPPPNFGGVDVLIDEPGFRLGLREFPATNTPQLDPKVAQVFDEMGMRDGKRYGLPFWVTAPMLSVNDDMLAGAGIGAPPLDWTWSDFEQVGLAASRAGLQQNLFFHDIFPSMVRAEGGRLLDPESGFWHWEEPVVQQSLARVAGWVQGGVLDLGLGEGLIYDGADKAPMTLRSDGQIYISGKTGLITYRPFPRGSKGRPVPATGLSGAITAESTQPELAAEYIRELVLNPAIRLELAQRGFRPVVDDPSAMAAWRAAVGEPFAEAVELALSDLYGEDDTWMQLQIREAVKTLEPFLTGQTSLDSVMLELRNQLK